MKFWQILIMVVCIILVFALLIFLDYVGIINFFGLRRRRTILTRNPAFQSQSKQEVHFQLARLLR